MKEEIMTAVMFFIRFIEKSDSFPRNQLDNFKKHLSELLIERFEKHWFPHVPSRGQGYRCIRVNCVSPVDLTLEIAASKCGLNYRDLRLPAELTVWVDPNEVCYRLGESEGSYCTLATFSSNDSSSTSSSSDSAVSTPASSPPSTPYQEKPRRSAQRAAAAAAVAAAQHHHPHAHQQHYHQQRQHQQQQQVEFANKQRTMGVLPAASLRVKPTNREMNFSFNPNNRQMYRCDGPQYPMTQAFYRNMNYNRTHKNILRV